MHFYQNVRSDQQNSATKKCVYSFTCVAQQMLGTAEFLVGLWQRQKKHKMQQVRAQLGTQADVFFSQAQT